MADEMQLFGRVLCNEGLQARGHLRHRRRHARIAEHVHVKSMGTVQVAPQESRLVPVQPQAMQVDDQARVHCAGGRTRMCSSLSCASLTSVGASVSGSAAV